MASPPTYEIIYIENHYTQEKTMKKVQKESLFSSYSPVSKKEK